LDDEKLMPLGPAFFTRTLQCVPKSPDAFTSRPQTRKPDPVRLPFGWGVRLGSPATDLAALRNRSPSRGLC